MYDISDVKYYSNDYDADEQLEEDLVGLAPVKERIKEISALLLVQRLRKNLGLGLKSTSVGLVN